MEPTLSSPSKTWQNSSFFKSGISDALFILMLGILLCWPALINGQPMFHPDTSAYIRGPAYALQHFFNVFSEWSEQQTHPVSSWGNSPRFGFILSGRSVYYGSYLYLGHIAGHLWPAVFGQGMIAAAGAYFTVRHMFQKYQMQVTTIVVLGLALFSPLPFFASFLMPDLFAGLAILAIANLTMFGNRMGWSEATFWLFVLVFGALSHSTVVLLIVILFVISIPIIFSYRSFTSSLGMKLGLAAVLVSLMGELIFNSTVEMVFGNPPVRPPFVTARLIEDGPGYTYLKSTCPDSGFRLCSKLEQLPMPSDAFLWGPLFANGDLSTKRALVDEQPRFVMETILHDPLGQIAASLNNWRKQSVKFGLNVFNYSDANRINFMVRLPPSYSAPMRDTISYKGLWPINALNLIVSVISALSSLMIFAFLIWRIRNSDYTTSCRLFSIVIVSGVLANSMICGVLSGPHDRYQARVIWLLPLLAMIICRVCYPTLSQGRRGLQPD